MKNLFPILPLLLHSATSHATPPVSQERLDELYTKWDHDFAFTGITTFAHLSHTKCLLAPSYLFDIAILGVPFDTAVTYRPGARFGPRAIRAASARQTLFRAFNPQQGVNPYAAPWARIVDCGDVPVSPFDNTLALRQMEDAMVELLRRPPHSGVGHPRLVSLGGDHTIALAALRALKRVHGAPTAVLHFDAHLDTWLPARGSGVWTTDQAKFTHGTMFAHAYAEGLLAPSVHAGLRTRLSGTDYADYADDDAQGWTRISTDDIDDIGVSGVVAKILDSLRGKKVYISVDIDVIDPGMAPGTGTPEAGGWTTRELLSILRRVVKEVEVVGADVVEVAPAYDPVETTALAASQVVFEILSGIIKRGPPEGWAPPEMDDVKDEL